MAVNIQHETERLNVLPIHTRSAVRLSRPRQAAGWWPRRESFKEQRTEENMCDVRFLLLLQGELNWKTWYKKNLHTLAMFLNVLTFNIMRFESDSQWSEDFPESYGCFSTTRSLRVCFLPEHVQRDGETKRQFSNKRHLLEEIHLISGVSY